MRMSELFYSIQGEGIYQGLPTVFLRTQGCNLAVIHGGCVWCDTKYAQSNHGGEDWTHSAIINKLADYPCNRVCLTGGEPLDQCDSLILGKHLKNIGYTLDIETNGSVLIGDNASIADCWIMDIKCPSSGMQSHNCLDNLKLLRECDQVKFVVADVGDIEYAQSVMDSHPTKAQILYSPVYEDSLLWLQELAEHVKKIPRARLSLQLHKFIWGQSRYEGSDITIWRTGFSHDSCCG
ncbi:MAG: 7-carboxy-7-deazaguanine synthase QueE [Chloroflexota bacterium]|nr:7-carboxy-7-deazaguanine synthase QueE [Chloroflexota bacterium]